MNPTENTLSGYNSKLSNQPFEKKREKTVAAISGTQIFVGYKNGLALNNIPFTVNSKELTLATAEQWNADHIEARNEAMVDMLAQRFKFEVE